MQFKGVDPDRAGLLNADDPTAIVNLVNSAADGFAAALRDWDSSRARLLLRLLAALVAPGVIQPTTVLTAFGQIVRSALEIATEGPTPPIPPSFWKSLLHSPHAPHATW